LELLQDNLLVNARDHVWWLDEWETEGGLHVDTGTTSAFVALEINLDELEEITESLLLWKHIQVNILMLFQEFGGVLSIVFICPFEIFLGLLAVAQDFVDDSSNDPELMSVLLGDGVDDVV
jgi:hypothetical protein